MKKLFVFAITIFMLLPMSVNAEKVYTKITGNEKIRPGENIVYTIILDRNLTKYEAEITYDRNVLNLVSIEEVKIDTAERSFNVEKSNPIKVSVDSSSPTLIIYTVVFNAKNNINVQKTEINVKILTAINGNESFNSDTAYFNMNFIEEDSLFVEEDNTDKDYITKILNDVKNILKDYGNFIMYISLLLNVILIIVLITNIRRKRVDYDF